MEKNHSGAALYLELLKKSVLGELYWENEARLLYARGCLERGDSYSYTPLLRLEEQRRAYCDRYRDLLRDGRFLDDRLENLGFQHTMIGRLPLPRSPGVQTFRRRQSSLSPVCTRQEPNILDCPLPRICGD